MLTKNSGVSNPTGGRVLSGTINGDATLKNSRTEENERLGNLLYIQGKTQTPCKEPIGPGTIVAVAKLKNTRTGDTLCDEKAPFALQMPTLPPQLITYALAPKEKGEEDKVYAAMQRLLDEDITLRLGRDEETGDILLSGMGQLHIELSVEKAKRRFKVDIVLKTPKVPYRETVRGKCQVQGRHKKQSGGRGQFGDCWIEMEGLPRGSGYVFEDAIVGGVIPRQYVPAIDKGVQEAAARGFLAGCQVVDFRVKVYDGSYHTVDSSEMAFKVAGSIAFKKAMDLPAFRSGDTVKVHLRIVEGEKERIQVFQGNVIRIKRGTTSATFTVRKVSDGVGVERIFPLNSPFIDRVELITQGRVRRSRLYYLRALKGKAARIKPRGRF